MPVESLFPQGGGWIEVASCRSPVLRIDAAGGPPHCDFADERDIQVASPWCPAWRAVSLADVILDLFREVGDQLGSLCQVIAPDGISMKR